MSNFIDITGNKYGRLLVLYVLSENRKKWICRCDCGRTVEVWANNLRRMHTRSCGCLQSELTKLNKTLPNNEAAFNRFFESIERGAKLRNLEFSLSKEMVKELSEKNCYICGIKPQPRKLSKAKTPISCNGIDRLDSNKGYNEQNCKPCCWDCNRAKGDLSLDEFRGWLDRAKSFIASH